MKKLRLSIILAICPLLLASCYSRDHAENDIDMEGYSSEGIIGQGVFIESFGEQVNPMVDDIERSAGVHQL